MTLVAGPDCADVSPSSQPNTDAAVRTRAIDVAVVGTGYVGLTTGACLAHLGHRVICADIDADKIARLEGGELPIVEEGLDEVVRSARASEHLSFCVGAANAVAEAEIVLLCVPTPQDDDGSADLSYIVAAAREIGPALRPGAIVVNKSTVPVGSTEVVADALGRPDAHVVSNPEFLREGAAVRDFLHPARVVIGADHAPAGERVAELYSDLDGEIFLTDAATAETIKYAANAFLATKISFINDMSYFCESVGADVHGVADAIGMDPRIGRAFLDAGPGWGGSCFPKDSRALVSIAEQHGFDYHFMRSVIRANDDHQRRIVDRVIRAAGRTPGERLNDLKVAAFGLTFKAGTDDLRESPSLRVLHDLVELGAEVSGYDPTTSGSLSTLQFDHLSRISVQDTPVEAADDADIAVVLTEWPEFEHLDFQRMAATMRQRIVFDLRGMIDESAAASHGFLVHRLGRR